MRLKIFEFIKLRSKIYNPYEINFKHNLWRIENDLNWIFKDLDKKEMFHIKICLYWLDINLKNAFFPWILKIERELKSSFIYYYKMKYKDGSISHFLEQKNYEKLNSTKNPYNMLITKNLSDTTVDELVFSLTCGEFVNLLIYFNSFIKNEIAKDLKLNSSVFINVIKFLTILRNAIAHNKTIIKIKDDKNQKRYSLKKDLFDFEISKEEIDIISTNVSGSIYVLKVFLSKIDSIKKSKNLIQDVKKYFHIFYKTVNDKKEYQRIIKLLFLNYEKNILQI